MTLPHRGWRGLRALGILTATTMVTTMIAGPAISAPATGEIRLASTAAAIPDSYIVVFEDQGVGGRAGTRQAAVASTARTLADRYGASLDNVYGDALNGFAARMPERAARRLAADPAVAYVEQNQRVVLPSGVQINPPSWGLDRIDQRYLPLDGLYRYPNTAPNVHAYVIDTGIRASHVDFNGMINPYSGFDAVDGVLPADDCNGHGTHLAGTIGGQLHGVAKDVRLIPVRVLNCAGSATYAQVIAGVNWTTGNAVRPAVAILAIGGGPSAALDGAVTHSINSGIVYAVSAGSSNANACNYSPARVPAALTVAGTTITDARMSSGNYGTCLDIFAPGQSITSTWHTSDTATAIISGTSSAAAHVAGCAALIFSTNPAWTAHQVIKQLLTNATAGIVTSPGAGTPNRLLYCGP